MAARKHTNPRKPFDDFWIGEPNSGCWLWVGFVHPKHGYGSYRADGGTRLAHRVSYERVNGPIPDGKDLDHLCRVRSCVNPDHLEPVTRRENLKRSPIWSGNQTHCVNGHEFTEENTHRHEGHRRRCRECHKLVERRRRAERKVAA